VEHLLAQHRGLAGTAFADQAASFVVVEEPRAPGGIDERRDLVFAPPLVAQGGSSGLSTSILNKTSDVSARNNI